eukprot:TRINITY_DN64072_c0_g1_i1.p1 TRINITY_DN64072_c0_g1~~TRINITY_DN64072_c0_g1_i1.p1  ORF type:complete len:275 (-),score=47.68 TRINITY_DN64072_c0_g1_i1:110-829(-)
MVSCGIVALTELAIMTSVTLTCLYFGAVAWAQLRDWCSTFAWYAKTAVRSKRPTVLLQPLLDSDPKAGFAQGSDCSWWRSKMWQEKGFTDCIIKCNGKEWPAHRFILALGSPVLSRLFSSGMVESRSGTVDIQDASPEEVEHFLKFLYTGSTKHVHDARLWGGLLVLSDMYEVQDLASLCHAKVIETASDDNIVSIVQLLKRYDVQPQIQDTLKALGVKIERDETLRKAVTEFALGAIA